MAQPFRFGCVIGGIDSSLQYDESTAFFSNFFCWRALWLRHFIGGCVIKMVDAFFLETPKDNRKKALAVDPAKGKTEKKLYFSPHCGDETTTYYNEPRKIGVIPSSPYGKGKPFSFSFPRWWVPRLRRLGISLWNFKKESGNRFLWHSLGKKMVSETEACSI